MFSMSLKSVPLCLVSIAPMLIGVPVAATPGFVPQADVVTALEVLDGDAAALVAEELLELELELEQAASRPSEMAATAASAIRERLCSCLFMCSAFSGLQ